MPIRPSDCDGRPFRNGERVATMVIYCDIPKVGGATNFMNSGIVRASVWIEFLRVLCIHCLSWRVIDLCHNFCSSVKHIKPKRYGATFFSYIDPDTMVVDDGWVLCQLLRFLHMLRWLNNMTLFNRLTQHSGCPVLEGEKRIVTQWVRLGVDEENPWDSFDTCEWEVECWCFWYCLFFFWCKNSCCIFLLDSIKWVSNTQSPRTSNRCIVAKNGETSKS